MPGLLGAGRRIGPRLAHDARREDAPSGAVLKTVAGGELTATAPGGKVMIADAKGGSAMVTIADVIQSNGVIHVVDKVLLPK